MADRPSAPHDLAWYRDRWEELMDLLPASAPDEVVDQVRELQISVLDEEAEALEEMGLADAEEAKTVLQRIFDRLQKLRRENQSLQQLQEAVEADSPDEVADSVARLRERLQTLEEQQQVLADAGFEEPEHAVRALNSMKQQLEELYGEKEATERSAPDSEFDLNGDTFDQLQALMAREEKLQRELGVSSPDAVIEIVEGLTDQLEDLYQDRDADSSTDSIFAPAPEHAPSTQKLEEEFGVSDPDSLVKMVNDLTTQLDALYDGRKRLAELNLNSADEAIEMVQSMRKQLDSLYEQKDQMSEHGINGVNHALSMIDSMETQLSELYDERHRLAEQGVETPNEVIDRLEELEAKLNTLIGEREALQEKRDRLQAQFDELEDQIGTGDPDTITGIIDSLEAQLETLYEDRKQPGGSLPGDEPLLAEDTLARLETLDDEELDALPVGIFGIDDTGTIRRANENVLRWPDVEADDPDDLLGEHFFDDVAPATKNALFQGRFQENVDEGEMDEHFFYTYVGQRDASTNLLVHLHRKADQSVNWIVFRVL